MIKNTAFTVVALLASMNLLLGSDIFAEESLLPLKDGKAPKTFDELWKDYDPRKEPLDVEVLKEWEEDGVVMKVVRYRIGIFKGRKAMMAAVYGYPKGGTKLPGLVQAHGGGQSGDYKACLTNAKRGYATISLAWAGRLKAPGYKVNVKLFWEGKTSDPNYKVTTDWGVLDGYHAPGRYRRNFGDVKPDEHTIDPIESPRNSGWFLCTLGARRALTFLERQPEVDGDKLGVYGHSMGGQITVYTAGSDKRVKAAAPSCGGISYRGGKMNINQKLSWGNEPYLKNISCPIIFLSPANDFHGRINNLPQAISEIKTKDWRITSSPHCNHNDAAPYAVATQLWFDQFLKGTFKWPETPQTEVNLKTASGIPSVTVRPDQSRPVQSLKVYYCQQGGDNESHLNKIHRFWRSAKVKKQGDVWIADLPLYSIERPLWVYADVQYKLDKPISFAGYYYQHQTAEEFNVASLVELFKPEQLQAAGIKPTIKPTMLIEDFQTDWEDEWFTYGSKPNVWGLSSNKLYDPMYQAPKFAKLAFDVRSKQAGMLTLSLDGHSHKIDLNGKSDWKNVVLWPTDMTNKEGKNRIDWKGIHKLSMHFKTQKNENAIAPELRNLRWIEGTREELDARRKIRLQEAKPIDGKIYLDIKYADCVKQDIKTNMNKSFGGSPLVIGNKTYKRGIGTHANSEFIFFLGGKYQQFHAEVGVHKGLPASIRFTVFADDKPVFESGMMGKDNAPKVINLDVNGVSELRLKVDDGGNGKHADHANWGDAYVVENASASKGNTKP